MALREIRMLGDEMLTKPCREVKEITPRITELVDDLLDTMYEADGIGLAAPQVGVLRQVVVIDVWQDGINFPSKSDSLSDSEESGESEEPGGSEEPGKVQEAPDTDDFDEEDYEGPLIMINPVIMETEGEQTGDEGCLSLPGKTGTVTRPERVVVTFFDENMDEYELEADGLLARAICHEVDHLSGHMYVELVEGEIRDNGYDEDEDEDEDEYEYEEEEDKVRVSELDTSGYESSDEEEEEDLPEPEHELPKFQYTEPVLVRKHDE